ncbi:MAG: hypothetical protein HY655_12240, partial [Acidobacteria bacterium]|nr:hypothetical protein [Acidobacteriota bacterium]
MNARRYLPIGLLLIAIAAVWIAVRGGDAPGAPTPSDDDAALMEMPSGERLTLQ